MNWDLGVYIGFGVFCSGRGSWGELGFVLLENKEKRKEKGSVMCSCDLWGLF